MKIIIFENCAFSKDQKSSVYIVRNILQINLWLVSPSGSFRMYINNHLNENVYLLYFVFAQFEWKAQGLIFKDNDRSIIYAFILMWLFRIVTQRSRTLVPLMPLFKTFQKTSSQNCLLNHLQAWLKHPSHYFLFAFYTKIHHAFFFNSPELAINVSLKWWKWLKLTFKLWNLSPLRIFRNVYACVWCRLRKQFQKGGRNPVSNGWSLVSEWCSKAIARNGKARLDDMVCLLKNQSHYFLMTLCTSFCNVYKEKCKYIFWNARPKYLTQLVAYFISKTIKRFKQLQC